MSDQTVVEFSGEWRGLSNFFQEMVRHDGLWFPSGEHAFQAAKTMDMDKRREIAGVLTSRAAKQMGRRLELRPDWEQVKNRVMVEVLSAKFEVPFLRDLLVGSERMVLVEGNTWADTYWGATWEASWNVEKDREVLPFAFQTADEGKKMIWAEHGGMSLIGANMLGRHLMTVREVLA